MTADTTACPRCGGETTEAELTYQGCAECRAELAAYRSQDEMDELCDYVPEIRPDGSVIG